MKCVCCHSDWEKDELFHRLCPDCLNIALDDWKKEIEYIDDVGNGADFYLCHYFNVTDMDYDPQLVFVCRKFIKDQLELHNKETMARLRDYIENECEEEYIAWLMRRYHFVI